MGVNVDRLERDDYGETAGSFNVSGAVVLLVIRMVVGMKLAIAAVSVSDVGNSLGVA